MNHISNLVKNRFKLPVVVGGHHATLRPSWHLDEGHVDIVALGEGELNVNNIVDGIKGKIPWSSIDGIAYNKNGSCLVRQEKSGILHSLDMEWDIETVVKSADGSYRYPISLVVRNPALYLGGKPASEGAGVLYASRGCPYACEYCNATNRDGPKIRHMSLEKMIELTQEFIANGAHTFHNESDTFGIHPIDREYLQWIEEQRENGQDINFVNTNGFFAKYFFPHGKFSPERVNLLRDAGFRIVTIALDSFAERFNRGKLKGISSEMLKECFSYIKEQELNLDVYMIYLFPEQTDSELRTDIKNIELLSDNITTTTWRSLTYFPSTEYYNWAIKTRKFTEGEYKGMIQKGHSFYHMDKRFNFSNIKNPPLLLG